MLSLPTVKFLGSIFFQLDVGKDGHNCILGLVGLVPGIWDVLKPP